MPLRRLLLLLPLTAALLGAAQTVIVRTTDGEWIEGSTTASKIGTWPINRILSLHNGAPASSTEAAAITKGLADLQSKDRAARDLATDELTAIGLPVLTPLLDILKDTDQHEPKPLYNLFNRIIPSIADQPDRTAALVRLIAQNPQRGAWPTGDLKLGDKSIPWAKIRVFAVRQASLTRTAEVHSLRHSTQIESFDSGLRSTATSRLTVTASGFTRLSWKQDEWATGPNGLQKPAGNYKTNLVDGHPFGALLARINATGKWLFLGEKADLKDLTAGRLLLAINDNAHWQNNLGTYTVRLTLTNAYDLGASL